jgi:hypothetical protein
MTVGFSGEREHSATKEGSHHFQGVGKVSRLTKMDWTHVSGTQARDDLPAVRVHYIAKRIDRDERADNDSTADGEAGRADAALHGLLRPEHFAHGGARPRAEIALARCIRRGRASGAVAHLSVRAAVGAAQVQVEEDRGRDDGHLGNTGVEADALFFEVAHHTTCRVEAKG